MSAQVEADGDDFGATDFEIEFIDAAGSRCRGSLAQCWAVAFEEVPPIRGFGWSRGQQHFPGWWWSAAKRWDGLEWLHLTVEIGHIFAYCSQSVYSDTMVRHLLLLDTQVMPRSDT